LLLFDAIVMIIITIIITIMIIITITITIANARANEIVLVRAACSGETAEFLSHHHSDLSLCKAAGISL